MTNGVTGGHTINWLRVNQGFWLFLLFAVTVKILLQGDRHTVYPVYATAAHHWWAGASLYDLYNGIDLFRYSPTFAIAMTPFSLLPSRLGNILWVASSLASLWIAMTLFARHFQAAWSAPRAAILLLMAAIGSLRMVWNGQANTLLIALVLLAAVALKRQQLWQGALWLSFALFIKLWLVALVMLLVVGWPRLAPRVLVWCLGLAAIPFLTASPEGVMAQYHAWGQGLATDYGRWPGFRDLWFVWEAIHPPVHPTIYRVLQLAGGLATLGLTLWFRPATCPVVLRLYVIVSAWVCWQLLLGPASERATFGILAPLAAFGFLEFRQGPRYLAGAAWLAVAYFSLGDLESLFDWLPGADLVLPLSPLLMVAFLLHLHGSAHGSEHGRELTGQ